MQTTANKPITVRDVTDRAAKLNLAIVTYHCEGDQFPWCAEVVRPYKNSGAFARIGPCGIIGRGVDCVEAIKALGIDF